MSGIRRVDSGPRMSQAVVCNGTVYLAGQVGNAGDSIADQTRTCLEKVEKLLLQVNSNKHHILQTTIWLADMSDFAAMNEVWDAWVTPGHTPARACGEAKLASPDLLVEVMVVAVERQIAQR